MLSIRKGVVFTPCVPDDFFFPVDSDGKPGSVEITRNGVTVVTSVDYFRVCWSGFPIPGEVDKYGCLEHLYGKEVPIAYSTLAVSYEMALANSRYEEEARANLRHLTPSLASDCALEMPILESVEFECEELMLASIVMGCRRLFTHLMELSKTLYILVEDELPKIDSLYLYNAVMEGLHWSAESADNPSIYIDPYELCVEQYFYRKLGKWTFSIRDDLKADIPEAVWKAIEEEGIYYAYFAPTWYHPPDEYKGVDLAYRALWHEEEGLNPIRDRYNSRTYSKVSTEDLATGLESGLQNPLTREEILDLVNALGACGLLPTMQWGARSVTPHLVYPPRVRPVLGVLLALSRKERGCGLSRAILDAHGWHSTFFDGFVKLGVDIDGWVLELVTELMGTCSLALSEEVLLLWNSSTRIVPETLMGMKRETLVQHIRDGNPILKMTPALQHELERDDISNDKEVVMMRVIPEWIVPETSC